MKQLVIIILSFTVSVFLNAQGYKINVKIKGEKDKNVLLVIHHGANKYSIDTAHLDKSGKAEFSKQKALVPGMYLLAIEGSHLFDFLISDTINQNFTISTTKDKYLESLSFDGSPENQAFAEFMRFIVNIQKKQKELSDKFKSEDSTAINALSQQEESLNQQVEEKIKALREKFPGQLVVSVTEAMNHLQPKASDLPKDPTEKQRYIYEFVKQHYWDKISLTDMRLENTPILIPAIDSYFSTIIVQTHDSVIAAADCLLKKAEKDTAMFKFIAGYILRHYSKSKIMDMANVVVYLIDNYYLNGKIFVDDEKFMSSIIEYAEKNRPSLIGKKAKNLKMESISGVPEALYDIDAPYTLVYIFESSCGHCQTETPKVYKVFQEYREKGLAGYCIYNLSNKQEWTDYISKNNFTDWTNVWDPTNENDFKQAYSVYSVPQVYLLDKDKNIIGRNLDSVSLSQLLAFVFKNK
ncbi:MAG: DUF5106 domain-containing protein [Prevotellaceae bacterium]|jgi:thiol-disulfide isomerase/thioredoxin|nr:DUF5106 domain-containing protein [Prevotellaceae bacterium]